ncbi:MAG: alpha/beta fold hydrolase, partial [Gammaproteobacteria bacterium]
MTYTLQQIDIDKDRRLGFREAGQGPAALFLHGIGSGSPSFERQLDALSDSFRAIAWDAPGYGGSDDHPQSIPSDADYAADVLALLDALNIDEVVLCGHSLGGLIATACVALAPRRIKRVVLSSCASGNGMLPEALRNERLADRVDAMMTLGPTEH